MAKGYGGTSARTRPGNSARDYDGLGTRVKPNPEAGAQYDGIGRRERPDPAGAGTYDGIGKRCKLSDKPWYDGISKRAKLPDTPWYDGISKKEAPRGPDGKEDATLLECADRHLVRGKLCQIDVVDPRTGAEVMGALKSRRR